jgi:hypothetical protein
VKTLILKLPLLLQMMAAMAHKDLLLNPHPRCRLLGQRINNLVVALLLNRLLQVVEVVVTKHNQPPHLRLLMLLPLEEGTRVMVISSLHLHLEYLPLKNSALKVPLLGVVVMIEHK